MWFRKRKRRPKRGPDWFPIVLGTDPYTGANVFVPDKTLDSSGSYVNGPPGTGKTVNLMSIAEQAIRGPIPKSVLFVDPKFDPQTSTEVANGLMQAAHAAGRPFRFTTLAGVPTPTMSFNPLGMEFFHRLAPLHRAEFVLQATGKRYGNDYGPEWFQSAIGQTAIYIFKRYPRVATWRQLYQVIKSLLNPQQKTDIPRDINKEFLSNSAALEAAVSALAEHDAFNVSSAGGDHPFALTDAQIDVASLFRSPGVVYLGLNASVSPLLVPILIRLAVFSCSYTSQVIERQVPLWTFVDEFAVAASYTLKERLNLARGQDISLHLGAQTQHDLQTGIVDLRPNVAALGLKWTTRIDDPREQREFAQASGEKVIRQRSMSGNYSLGGTFQVERVTLNEQTQPYFSMNDVRLFSSDPEFSVIELRQDSPYVSYGGMPVLVRRIRRNDLHALRRPLPADHPGSFIPRTIVGEDPPEFVDRGGPVPPIHRLDDDNPFGRKTE